MYKQLNNEEKLHFFSLFFAVMRVIAEWADMKAEAQDGSDVPKKIITDNTLGYKSPGQKEQTQELKDKDEGVQIHSEDEIRAS